MNRSYWGKATSALPVALLVLFFVFAVIFVARAAEINVADGEVDILENDVCSIQEAIINANDNALTHDDCTGGEAGNDNINLPAASLFNIIEPQSTNATFGNHGLPAITSEITILGNGSTIQRDPTLPCVLDAFDSFTEFRLFLVLSGGDLDLQELTLQHGCADGDDFELASGGAITIDDGGEVHLHVGSLVRFNRASLSGGAVDNHGDLSIDDSELSENHVECLLSECVCCGPGFMDGGAIHDEGYVEIEESLITKNSVNCRDCDQVLGGGISNEFGFVGIYASEISYNAIICQECPFAGPDAFAGGGLFNDDEMEIWSSLIAHNTAPYGGGITNAENLLVGNSTIFGNVADEVGGGILNIDDLLIVNSTITQNSASGFWGGFDGFGCFGPETPVLMADGSTKAIKDVRVGDRVMSYDFASGRQVPSRVEATFQFDASEYLRLNGLRVTDSHPFATGSERWVRAGNLTVGDRVLGAGGEIEIARKDIVSEPLDVYTLQVAGVHNFYVSDGNEAYLVHNKMLPGGGGGLASQAEIDEVVIKSTIFSQNEGNNCAVVQEQPIGASGVADLIDSQGFNIDDDGTCDFSEPSDLFTDPKLDPAGLKDNGGPTRTVALQPDSPAINAIPIADCEFDGDDIESDQRGFDRPQPDPGDCDIGAFESRFFTLTVLGDGAGAGNVANGAINCDIAAGVPGGDCDEALPENSKVTLTSSAAAGSLFTLWDACAQVLANNKCQVVLTDDFNVTATFVQAVAKLAPAITLTMSSSFTIPFWCGEKKDEFSMDGKLFRNVEQYETLIEVVFPQRRILLIFPGPLDTANLLETATLTEPSNFQSAGDMTLPVRVQLISGKTLKKTCADLLALPTAVDGAGDPVENLTNVLAGNDFFHGIFALEADKTEVRVFVTKITRTWHTVEADGEENFFPGTQMKERREISRLAINLRRTVGLEVPAPVVAAAAAADAATSFTASHLSRVGGRAVEFQTSGLTIDEVQVEIFSLSGRKVNDLRANGNSLRWALRDRAGQPVANGVYLYLVSARGPDGQWHKSAIKKLVIIR